MHEPWNPEIDQEVEHAVTGRVGRVRARNNAVEDEVLVEWAIGGREWLSTTVLEPR